MGADTLDAAMAQSHLALHLIINGDPSGYKTLFAMSEDITLGNPFGPFARGRTEVEAALAGASRNYRDGAVLGIDLISRYEGTDMAVVVEQERGQAKIGGEVEEAQFSLRVTSVYRREDGIWMLVHRHADPISAPRAAETVIAR